MLTISMHFLIFSSTFPSWPNPWLWAVNSYPDASSYGNSDPDLCVKGGRLAAFLRIMHFCLALLGPPNSGMSRQEVQRPQLTENVPKSNNGLPQLNQNPYSRCWKLAATQQCNTGNRPKRLHTSIVSDPGPFARIRIRLFFLSPDPDRQKIRIRKIRIHEKHALTLYSKYK